jgi:hypothetical protein
LSLLPHLPLSRLSSLICLLSRLVSLYLSLVSSRFSLSLFRLSQQQQEGKGLGKRGRREEEEGNTVGLSSLSSSLFPVLLLLRRRPSPIVLLSCTLF